MNEDGRSVDWERLTTVKAFDYGFAGNGQDSARLTTNQVEIISPTATTPISLLVQSLVQQLCTLLERDEERANHLYNSICEKLHQMKLIDESYSMGEFEVMRSQYQRALYQLVSVASGVEMPLTLPSTWPILEPSGFEWSRYHREFEELFYISGGGFGNVFKAKHRLDGVEYAIKKICIRSSNINTVMNHLAEVKTLASLNHTNIVSYKAAWLEPLIETKNDLLEKEIDMDTDSSDTDDYIDKKLISYSKNVPSSLNKSSNSLVEPKSESDFVISFENSSNNNIELEDSLDDDSLHLNDDCKIICKLSNNKIATKCSRINLKWATLYIQMSLCQKTLKQWLEERNDYLYQKIEGASLSSSPNCDVFKEISQMDINIGMNVECSYLDTILNMFTQLVNGIHYIHSKGIVHHDIKPSNIFVGTDGKNITHVQVGDFGLACPLQQSHGGVAIGTHLYAAPEQLEGECNPKSDMYSLGIVLLEMTETFHTDMERVKTISDLRKGQIPARLTANYPKVAHIIGKLTRRKHSQRLDTSQLSMELKSLNDDKDQVIQSLKEELVIKDEEIAKLKTLLANCNI